MPTKTFLNLAPEKQKLLIEASEREFARVDFANASINRIIQDAGISRGSFYMYFENKEDLYFYILEKYMAQTYRELLKILDSCQGDFISAWGILHDRLIDFCMENKKGTLFKKMFLNMRYETNKKMGLKPPKDVIKQSHRDLLEHIDRTLYSYENDEALLDAFALVMLITTSSIVYTMMNSEERNREKKNYDRRLEIVRHGIMRKENKNA